MKAARTPAGTPVAALIKAAGQPTVQREIDRGRVDPCADDKRSVRALEYHVPIDSVTGPVRKLFGRPTVAAMTVVCLDKESKVLSTHTMNSNQSRRTVVHVATVESLAIALPTRRTPMFEEGEIECKK